jgi:hypothetical protein
VDQHWLNTGTSTDTDRFQYSYDRDSNRTQRTNAVNTLFSESYGYDSFNQLTTFTRNTHMETWGLDNVGNWKSFSNDQTGPPSETRNQNAQNQITTHDPAEAVYGAFFPKPKETALRGSMYGTIV